MEVHLDVRLVDGGYEFGVVEGGGGVVEVETEDDVSCCGVVESARNGVEGGERIGAADGGGWRFVGGGFG